MPQEEKLGVAQNTQATAIDAAAASQEQAAQSGAAPGFDKEAFKASVKARIDELTPKDPKQMENIEGSSVFGDVKSAVDHKVETGKDQAQGNVDDKVKEAPNPGAVSDKPVTGLLPNAPGQAPGQLDASGATPKPKGAEEVEQPLQTESKQLDTQMATAQITPEQLQTSNEPTFQAALQAKTGAQEHVQQALPQYRSKEQGQIQGAQQEAGTLAQTGLGAIFTTRTGTFGQMDTLQNTAKGSDEQKRAEIGRQIDGIFQRTKTDVEGILTALDTQVDQTFTSGADAAKAAAVAYIKRETEAYKAARYNQDADWWRVDQHIAGAATHAWDALTSMPDEYFEYYRQGRDLYVAEMDKVLDKVATIVGNHLARAHERVQQGRDEIKKFVESQPEELREVAQQAAQDAESKFGELEQTIDSKQSEIVDSLAQKYVEKLQALDSELEQMKEAEKSLLAKAGDMINGVIKTIGELKDLLLNTLQRAAGAVMKILQDPIGFLGNLLSAVGQGLRQFVGNIGTHLKEGLISWLTGALTAGGIQLPTTWDLQGIFSLVMQILGLTYQQIRAQIVKALGPIGEMVIGALEQAWEVFQIIQNEGLAGLWTFIQEQVGNLQVMVMDQIREMVIGQVIKAGIDWLIGILGGPAGAFIKAVQAIVRVVTWFVDNAARVASLVNSVLDSVMAIASGDISGAAGFIEQSLAKALPTVISFLADLLGLGGISHKVQEIIGRVRAPIQKGIDWLVQKAVALGKKLWGMLTGRSQREGGTSPNGGQEQIGKVVQFQAAEENHRLWVEVQGHQATLMVASEKKPVSERLEIWDNLLDTNEEMNAAIGKDARPLIRQAYQIIGVADPKIKKLAKDDDISPDDASDEREVEAQQEILADVMMCLFNLFGEDVDRRTRFMKAVEGKVFERVDIENVLSVSQTSAGRLIDEWKNDTEIPLYIWGVSTGRRYSFTKGLIKSDQEYLEDTRKCFGQSTFGTRKFLDAHIISSQLQESLNDEPAQIAAKAMLDRWVEQGMLYVIDRTYTFRGGEATGPHPSKYVEIVDGRYVIRADIRTRKGFIRRRFYGKEYDLNVVQWKDEKLSTDYGQVSPSGYMGLRNPENHGQYWYNGRFYNDSGNDIATVDHKPLVSAHWNGSGVEDESAGRNNIQEYREGFYNGEGDPERHLTIMPKTLNSSEGSSEGESFLSEVGRNFRGPNEAGLQWSNPESEA